MGPILITGGTGQVARALEAHADGLAVLRVGRPDFDFDNLAALPAILEAASPRMILNAAAYTAVDKAESENEAADRANHVGPKLLAEYCARKHIPLIHISTDYVFDGSKTEPYVETDPTGPTGVYGTTKLAGEHAVLAANPQTIVLRTAWVYAAEGKNFVLTMLNAAKKMPKLRVVGDQVGNPTLADDLARAMLAIVAKIDAGGWRDEYRGVFHASGTGSTSWHGLASEIFRISAAQGNAVPDVDAIATADWPTPAKRPANSRLDGSKLNHVFGLALPQWQESLAHTLEQIFAKPV